MSKTRERAVLDAAIALYDNRLGHRRENPLWSAPQEFWTALGAAIEDLHKGRERKTGAEVLSEAGIG